VKAPIVTIKNYCLNHVGYFDWLVTGLGLLEQKSELHLRFDLPAIKRALSYRYLRWGAKALCPNWVSKVNGHMWWLEGEINFNGKISRFVFDVTDHCYNFAEYLLPECNCYFKCQLHDAFPDPLPLNRQIQRPMSKVAQEFAHKVKPAMLGRPLSRALDFRKNLRMLRDWETRAQKIKSKRVIAYFGNDIDCEATSRLSHEQGLYQHPNLKRGRIVRYLRSLNHSQVDARLVQSSDDTFVGPAMNDDATYANAVAAAAYNINVSGLSLSLPFRFIDSFMLGTAVATDDLSLHWYAPFDDQEVMELGPMGYELDADVDWNRVEDQLLKLVHSNPDQHESRAAHLINRYRQLWSPEALARYVVNTCANSI
jgi:hypothetical protein